MSKHPPSRHTPSHVKIRKINHLRHPYITATADSCGLGFGDFCRFCKKHETDPEQMHCSLFGELVTVDGEVSKPPTMNEPMFKKVIGLALNDHHLRVMGAILGMGPTIKRCSACLAADAGEASEDEARQFFEIGPHHRN